ncbi:MAG: hypothetical protein H6845_02615 [Alphaproteobacteria bacterium]|nr:MAG: hypothetical protein H6845_02615 [Alphaproteobacteria bacterium]
MILGLSLNSITINNRNLSAQYIEMATKYLTMEEIVQKFNVRFQDSVQFITDLESLKLFFKQTHKKIDNKLRNEILNHLPNNSSQIARDLSLYLTLVTQISNSIGYDPDFINKNHLEKADKDLVRTFQVLKVICNSQEEAIKIKNELSQLSAKDYEAFLIKAKITYYKYDIVMDFQLDYEELSMVKSTVIGTCSDTKKLDGKYVFFLLIDNSILDKERYIAISHLQYQQKALQYIINQYKNKLHIKE